MKTIIATIMIAGLCLSVTGCKEKPQAQSVVEAPKTATEKAETALTNAAHQTGDAINQTAEKAWEGIKHGAQEVSHAATNVAAEVKTEAHKASEGLQEATK
jgi:hypothetical protein